jgi:hypothetical protein
MYASVYSVMGVKVKKVAISNQSSGIINITLDLSSLPAGLYNLMIISTTRKLQKKIIITR